MWLKWILIFCITSPVLAFRFTSDFQNGFYWATLPISIQVIEGDPSRKAMLEDLAKSAVMKWEDSSGLSLWDFVGAGTRNIIRWSNNFAAETRMDPATVLAVAIRYTNGPYFAKTEIVINGGHTYNQDQAYLHTTLTHELGHTMGLDHSDVSEAVMAPTLQPWFTDLHNDDVQGILSAHAEIENRQITRYVSPLAYSSGESTTPLSCATVGPVTTASALSSNGLLSLVSGLLISFVRKILLWFKSRF